MSFTEFKFHPAVIAGVTAAGYQIPTPIQTEAIPPIMKGRDLMGLSQTGTGKTAAFVLPILNRLVDGKRGGVRALIIAPTRELAEQIHQVVVAMGRKTRLKSVSAYGGVPIDRQMKKIRQADIVVGCPGRLLDHINRRTIDLGRLEVLVLDEADQMFDMGFIPDIRRILTHLPSKRQTLLFSATMPMEIRHLAEEVLEKPARVKLKFSTPVETVSHAFYPVSQYQKTELLLKLLEDIDAESILIFTRTKHRAKKLDRILREAGCHATSLQGNLSQARRQEALDGFRTGKFKILVATDIAARGIDVTHISHVINYDIPSTPDLYIHRIGRTGRAARSGEAFTLITQEDKHMVRAVNRLIGSEVKQCLVSSFDYGTSITGFDEQSQEREKLQRRLAGKGKFGKKSGHLARGV